MSHVSSIPGKPTTAGSQEADHHRLESQSTPGQTYRHQPPKMLTKNLSTLMKNQSGRNYNQVVGRSNQFPTALNRLHQQQIKSIHIENSVGNTLPFKFRGPETSKAGVAFKVVTFFFVGFFTPFAIARYQMKKSGAWP
ncbi:hypothetical protein PTTG_06151 [Puccinia triticina 1-1 BBBD Race 1]|uniref:Cytochrome c oxidase subunit VIIc n=2 Tax=Puccinia triticina TaxID=208348 RepID=A0A180H2A2_PUCT1|nr:uncharacterized protein PtA15_4A137 [Puccinia triticina]OAV99166.1 hypothetical protein PTTG_06151 [Puccinia triticina 1-1 BBBD Race 1]WAQ83689.1 hypothetical protein PtA15_4A137 [Puccinia triticina]WAR54537.1 hypothetical protein PtB15_4B154 [Puccinia triticina]